MDDIQSQIDDILSRLDENDSSFSDLSDSVDSSTSDLQSTLDDQSSTISDLQEASGQLTFPLTQETIDLIKEQFPVGQVTLSGGTTTLKDERISTNSNIFLSVNTANGSLGFLSSVITSGQAIINSSDVGDNSIISYLII